MSKIKLGNTGILTERNAFGALPIQRIEMAAAIKLLRKSFDGGITFFDTARGYSDSEEKMGQAFKGMRDKIFIATKTPAKNPENFWTDLDTSLTTLKTDYIDIYQFHNPAKCYKPGDGSGMYECMQEAKKMGKIRQIGLTSHKLDVAHACIDSGIYATLQFPFSYLSSDKDIDLVMKSNQSNMGFIAMKALSGGLITDSKAAYAFISQFENVLPIWGIQYEPELDEFLTYIHEQPQMNKKMREKIDNDKNELTGDFCRGCGYCMPCPEGITISICARMSLLIKRSPEKNWVSQKAQEMMQKTEKCTECGQCIAKCPYDLDPPSLLKKNYAIYKDFLGS